MNYDGLIITNLPNYYKIRLFHEIAQSCAIYVIFISASDNQRNDDFLEIQNQQFDYTILSENFNHRNVLSNCLKISRILFRNHFKNVILGEWVSFEYWWTNLFFRKKNTSMMLESNIHSTHRIGIKENVKKVFLLGVNQIFASGDKQEELAKFLGFKRKILNTRGVGIIHYGNTTEISRINDFLFIGRLSEEKNLEVLIKAFTKTKHKLTIIGEGSLMSELREGASENINFLGYIPNAELGQYFKSHRALILVSKYEPYGLVAEESIYYGTPVIISAVCGIVNSTCFDGENSLVVDYQSIDDIQDALDSMLDLKIYENLKSNCKPERIKQKNHEQVEKYIRVLKSRS